MEKIIVISVSSQQESQVKRTHRRGASCTASRCSVTPAKCQPGQQNLEDVVRWRKGGGIKENMGYGGGEVNEISFELFLPPGDGEVFKADAGPA